LRDQAREDGQARLLMTAPRVLLQRLLLMASHLQDGSGQVTSRDVLEQLGDEAGLGSHVTSADVPKLPFPDHRHRLIARQRSSRRPEAVEAEPWADQTSYASVVYRAVQFQATGRSKTRPLRRSAANVIGQRKPKPHKPLQQSGLWTVGGWSLRRMAWRWPEIGPPSTVLWLTMLPSALRWFSMRSGWPCVAPTGSTKWRAMTSGALPGM
jgi:hypothetical protein